jgi:benzoyl-CoA reductase/2-hydroxyglutaryl-CoA dehydratase subunit BcrC/BadD/HgdB
VGETTCDAKKKAWDLLGMKVLEVPQKKNVIDRDLWLTEVYNFKEMVEKLSGVKITSERLKGAIKLVNDRRRALLRINETRKLEEPPINGLDALLVSQLALNMDVREFNEAANVLADELDERANKGVSAYEKPGVRVMFAGSPSPLGNAKVHHVVESSGMRIVADESCTGLRYFRDLVDEGISGLDGMVEAIADRYFKIDCACFSPNSERVENIAALIREYNVGGVIHNILQYCHGFDIEAGVVDRKLAELGVPSLKIVTDYSEEDLEQIRVRTEAFSEVIKAPSHAASGAAAKPKPEKTKG